MRQNKQLNMCNIDIESIKAWEKKLNKQTCESRNEINTIKIRVSKQRPTHARTSLHVQNQAFVCIQDYAYASSCLENPKSTTKLKILNLTH